MMASDESRFDAAVIGAGFGGLATALRLAEAGVRVILLERLHYPGGCAATFTRQGHRFEAGATLFAGFGPGELFERWIAEHRLPVTPQLLDPCIEFRTPDFTIETHHDRDRFIEAWCALPGAPSDEIRRFFRFQRRIAARLWDILGSPETLPPWRLTDLPRLARSALPGVLSLGLGLTPWLGRPLEDLLRHFGLDAFEPLRQYLDSACQITVQCGVREAEIAFALGAIDYVHRGAAHIEGGIGVLASALVDRIRALGGEVRMSCAVKGMEPARDGWTLTTRKGAVHARQVVAGVLPATLRSWIGDRGDRRSARFEAKLDRVEAPLSTGWGACMLYRSIDGADLPAVPHHLQLRSRGPGEAIEGHHVFCSLSGEADGARTPNEGERTVTISTHIPLARLRVPSEEQAAIVEEVQERMRGTVEQLAPELAARTRREWTASPRTFERFTGRPEGWVGGVPRRASLDHYRSIGPTTVAPGLHLVGDSVFPGQSTLATAIGGLRVAERVLRT